MPPLVNRLFYTFKPLIPRFVQIAIRRQIAQCKRKKHKHDWPIDVRAAAPPIGWKGWPDGKQFALVLSHDVDTKRGQDRVENLAALEMELGFRSAFNFVPERYKNHEGTKSYLRANAFEINVHGLKHDGKLFSSRRIFEKRAVKINQYLREWGSAGFTSPSMLCRADWLHELNITHSISSFDTDPFEPEPNPRRTIFPFWVSSGRPFKGYVELPYTLPQDHFLFIILQEKTIDIWKRKLDYIASCGGMALLNTHSDYMNFKDHPLANEEYPAKFYESFLHYVIERYKGKYCNVLPGDIARHCFNSVPKPSLS